MLRRDKAIACYNRGIEKGDQGRHEAAIGDYDEAIGHDPSFVDAWYNRGIEKGNLGRYDDAIRDYDEAIRLKKNHYEAYYNRGWAKINLKRYDEAIHDYDEAIRRKPDDAEAYCNRGIAKAKLGHYDEAIRDYDKAIRLAIRLDRNFAEIYYNLGVAKAKLECYDEAIDEYYKAICLKPQFSEAYNGLDLAEMNLERQNETIDGFDKANHSKTGSPYNRAPRSDEFLALFRPGQILSPLVEKHRGEKDLIVKDNKTPIDVHFLRGGDRIRVYGGKTRLFDLWRLQSGVLKLEINESYKEQPCSEKFLMRWDAILKERDANSSSFENALRDYLDKVKVDEHREEKEAYVQSKWSQKLEWQPVDRDESWIPFDREIELENRDLGKLKKKMDDALEDTYNEILQDGRDTWKEPKLKAKELDQLAIDTKGRIVLIEIKSGKDGDYYAPFQLLQYIWQWYSALRSQRKRLLREVQRLLEARVEVGLTPDPKVRLIPCIRGVVCLGHNDQRTVKVRSRHGIVLNIVNKHLPPGVPDIETWKLDEHGRPCKVTEWPPDSLA